MQPYNQDTVLEIPDRCDAYFENIPVWIYFTQNETFREGAYLSPYCAMSIGNSAVVETSVLDNQLDDVFNRLCCKDRTVWDRMLALATEDHDPLAQAVLAIGYFHGYFTKDVERSQSFGSQCVAWLLTHQGKDSCDCLGTFYYFGISVPADKVEGARYYRLAAEAGSVLGQVDLGCYLYNCDKNYGEAENWIRLAANANNSMAQDCLGCLYRNGQGVTQDFKKALEWSRLSADQGFPSGQSSMGCAYYKGQGVQVDFIEAVRWFQLAADQGHPNAQAWLGLCYDFGHGIAVNKAQMIEWYQLAVAQNNVGGQYNLGYCYELGNGVTKDISEAIRLYTLAAEQGHEEARTRLGVLQFSKN